MDEILSNRQRRFLREVRSTIERIENDDLNESKDSTVVLQKITIIEDNVDLIIKHLKKGGNEDSSKDDFKRGFPLWDGNVRDCINRLREIVEVMKKDKRKCNATKLGANIASLAGGGIAVASVLTGGLVIPAGIAIGTIMTATGTATSFGTAVTELYILQASVDKAKEIIREASDLLGMMNNSLQHSNKLIEAISEVLKIDIVQDILPSIKKLVKEGMEIRNADKRLDSIEKNIREMVRHLTDNKKISEMASMAIVSLLVGFYTVTSSSENRFLFECASLIVKMSMTTAFIFVEDIIELIGLAGVKLAKDVAKVKLRCIFAVIGMAFDAICIILTSIDLAKGSFCKEAKIISDLADEMEKEADILQNVYNSLK